MRPQLHTMHGSADVLIPALIRTPRSPEALDDLFRPALALSSKIPAGFLQQAHFPYLRVPRIDWAAVAAISFVYTLAFVVWLYLAK